MIPCTKIFKGLSTIHTECNTGPLFAWNITARCNLKCSHCYRDSETETSSQLSAEKCLQLIDEIKALNPPIVLLTGGEPLLRKNIFDIVEKCKGAGLKVGLSTNGTIIDKDMARKIKQSGIDYAGISIDGRDAIHDEFRGSRGAWSLSWAAIEHLNVLGVKTGVRFTLTDKNKEDLFSVLEKTFTSGTKRFCLYHLVYSGRGRNAMDITPHKKRKIMKRFFSRVKELSLIDEDFEVLTADNHADGAYMLKFLIDDEKASSCVKAQGGCSAGEKIIYLDSTGEVYPCQFLREQSLGNVKDRPLPDIWEDSHNLLLRMMRNKGRFLQGKCSRCTYKEICGGCRARARVYSGSLWGEDPACYLQESEIAGIRNRVVE